MERTTYGRVINYQLSIINYQLSIINYQLFSPTSVAVFLKAVFPDIHKIILIDVALDMIAANARAGYPAVGGTGFGGGGGKGSASCFWGCTPYL